MTDAIRCTQCKGNKKYAPLGGIMVECKPCNGIGFMNTVQELVSDTKPTPITEPVSKPQPLKSKAERMKAKQALSLNHPLNQLKAKINHANSI